jgi:hypothetical protein
MKKQSLLFKNEQIYKLKAPKLHLKRKILKNINFLTNLLNYGK